MPDDGSLAAERLARIAGCSAGRPGVTRLPWTPEHRAALQEIEAWMRDAGLEVALDAAGTLRGRSPAAAATPRLLLGSHQDSVRRGGAYDGIMGIALGCLAAARFRDRWDALPFGLEVLAFADEEGVRFPTALIGPRALAGTLDPAVLMMRDADGVEMGAAMRDFGVETSGLASLADWDAPPVGYLEAHIEQGPVLERAGQPLGIVTAICGIARYAVTVAGETGHAGTVPMRGRRDALVGAARMIDAVAREAVEAGEIRATVGTLTLGPGAVNAIPDRVAFTLEVRAPRDAARDAFVARMKERFASLAQAEGLGVTMERTYAQAATACDPGLMAALATGAGGDAPHLPSGATHDASAMADLCPVAMLFLPCRGGVSHRPDEYAAPEDMGAAVDALEGAIRALAARTPR
ncbi:M20 family metallo-hydrolase [Jannaschia seohaensis]|uniref:Allantoate deiminase n=1 Tax=Jannaschia seohaensis TaxID=475081 RepID=A0A2Y9B504_9RHOB|nr:M20 family metallo-hydrolase [Jannaschia seohaensis]PWJ11190.1 allantoate deiminase [Jannaschia seohaensis]SSA51491.1 allantoate deiminase [Jannaschia seohaensis]